MTNYFLKKLANFLSASGREVPFDTSILSQVYIYVYVYVYVYIYVYVYLTAIHLFSQQIIVMFVGRECLCSFHG